MQTLLLALALLISPPQAETKFLAFQIFTGSTNPAQAIGGSEFQPLGSFPSKASLLAYVRDIRTTLGSAGIGNHKLAVIFGPLAFDRSDGDVKIFISSAFAIGALEKVAVGFHIDDSMFWAARKSLLEDPSDIEWSDWRGTASTSRRIDWGSQPSQLPPQMCFNSKRIEQEVQHRAALIGRCISSELAKSGKPDLFAGVIAGWETQIGQDFKTGSYLGFHALKNLGYSASTPPAELDQAREKIVADFIDVWCKGLHNGGVASDRIYSHTAFLSEKVFNESAPVLTYAQFNHFAPPNVSFGKDHRPGFSTYPQPGMYDQIYSELASHGVKSGWASSEGTNLQLGGQPGQSGMNMETYLAKMFNHGAMLVNIFAWGTGGPANKNSDFRKVTEGPEAISAYRKFLSGKQLLESATTTSYLERLPPKIQKIQKDLPDWILRTGRRQDAQPLLAQLDAAVKAKNFDEAELIADKILQLIGD